MISPLKILIVDDHAMIRKGMRLTIETTFGIKSIEEASSCSELLNTLHRNTFTHIILDLLINDGNALEIIPSIKNLYPQLRILIFSMQPPDVYAIALKQYGLYEYLHKEAEEPVTIATLKKFFYEEKPSAKDAIGLDLPKNHNPFSALSTRELEVLHYLLNGIGTKSISETLNLQMSTISTMKSRIFEKTNTTNIKELIDLALIFNISS